MRSCVLLVRRFDFLASIRLTLPGPDLTEKISRNRSKKCESRRNIVGGESGRDQVQRPHDQNRGDPDTFYLTRFFVNMFSETDQYRDHEDYRKEQRGYRNDYILVTQGISDTCALSRNWRGAQWIAVAVAGGGAGLRLVRGGEGRVRREERRRRDRSEQQDGESGGRTERPSSEPFAEGTEHRPAAVQNSRRTPMRAVRAVRS